MFCDIQSHLLFLYPFKKKKICAVTRVQFVDYFQLEVHWEFTSMFKPMPWSYQAALNQWLISVPCMTFLTIFAVLNGSLLNWPRHCQTDIVMKAHSAHFWFLFPVLSQMANPHYHLKGFFCCCSIWLSFTSIFHGNHSSKPFYILNIVSMSTFWWPKWHRKWLLREKKKLPIQGKIEDNCCRRVHE